MQAEHYSKFSFIFAVKEKLILFYLKKGRFFDVFETSFPEVALEYFSYSSRKYISGSPESPC